MFVKICGVTRALDARAAVDAGADAIGLNFWPRSKRFIADGAAAVAAAVRGHALLVGVFVNPSAAEVAAADVDVVQLHGDETPDFGRALGRRLWRAVRVAGPDSLRELAAWRGVAEAFLLDSATPGYGGSGQAFDWTLARSLDARVIVAGGLTPDNVGAALRAARPWGCDVAGGVERAPGIKDHERMARFIQAARAEEL